MIATIINGVHPFMRLQAPASVCAAVPNLLAVHRVVTQLHVQKTYTSIRMIISNIYTDIATTINISALTLSMNMSSRTIVLSLRPPANGPCTDSMVLKKGERQHNSNKYTREKYNVESILKDRLAGGTHLA